MDSINKPFFSIILSTYKEDKYLLKRSIESILNQSYEDFEFIIINDNPDSDNSFFKFYESSDLRVKIFQNKKNIGLTRSLNKAISLSNGMYIVRQDADDYSKSERLINAFNYINNNNNVIFYSSPYIIADKIKPNRIFRKIYNSNTIRYKNFLAHGALIVKSEIIKKLKYNSKFRYAQDFDLYNRLIDQGYYLHYDIKNVSYFLGTNVNRISIIYKRDQQLFFNKVLERTGFKFLTTRVSKFFRFDLIVDIYYAIKKQ